MKATKEHPCPEDFEEFLDWFPTEKDCRDYFEWGRWADGFVCQKCGSTVCWELERGIRKCGKFRKLISVTNGTVFDSGKKALRLWFHVMWLLMAQKTGRGAACKTLVLVAVEGSKGGKLGRVRFRIVDTHTSEVIRPFVADYVSSGSTVVTDGLKSYNFFDGLGITHEPYVLSRGGQGVDSNLEHVHLVISLVKRWMLGTLQGAVAPEHMAGYLDEFAFRFNRRMSTHRGKLFHRLIQQAITTRPKNIKDLYNHRGTK